MIENRGNLDLVFRRKSDGKTYLARQYFKLPLQVMPPHYQDDDGTAFLYLLNPSGGILQHDRLVTRVNVEKNARVFMTTPGNTKFYKMDDGHAELMAYFNVGENGVLEYLPEHNVPFAGSNTYQVNEFRLTASSVLITWDIITPGRVSSGEKFDYDIFASKTKIYVDEKMILYDNSVLEPARTNLLQLGLLENYDSNGTVYIYKSGIDPNLIDCIKNIEFDGIFGISQVAPSLIVIKFMGNNTSSIKEFLMNIWSKSRKTLLGKNSVRIRKY